MILITFVVQEFFTYQYRQVRQNEPGHWLILYSEQKRDQQLALGRSSTNRPDWTCGTRLELRKSKGAHDTQLALDEHKFTREGEEDLLAEKELL